MKTHHHPPVAKKQPKSLVTHNDQRIDPYFWLKEREDQEVIDYLNAENAYCEQVMEPTRELQQELFEEMKSRIKEDDQSVPYKYNGYWYLVFGQI